MESILQNVCGYGTQVLCFVFIILSTAINLLMGILILASLFCLEQLLFAIFKIDYENISVPQFD